MTLFSSFSRVYANSNFSIYYQFKSAYLELTMEKDSRREIRLFCLFLEVAIICRILTHFIESFLLGWFIILKEMRLFELFFAIKK
jgi:hypothetical protein